jgi:hypothetical protein
MRNILSQLMHLKNQYPFMIKKKKFNKVGIESTSHSKTHI